MSRLPVPFLAIAFAACVEARAVGFAAPAPGRVQDPTAHDAPRRGPGPLHKALASPGDDAFVRLRASGVVAAEVDYGAFSLFVLDERLNRTGRPFDALDLPVDDDMDLVRFDGRPLDGAHPEPFHAALAPAERFDPLGRFDPSAGLFVVQFVGPVRDEWLAVLDALAPSFAQYVPANAYVVALSPLAAERLPALLARAPFVQYAGVYEPGCRIAPDLRASALAGDRSTVPMTLQLVDDASREATLDRLRASASVVLQAWESGPYVHVHLDAPASAALEFARLPSVFAVEFRGAVARLDEVQGQILAGAVGAAGPTGPGYLAWLAARGFGAAQFGGFSVNVVDDAAALTAHPDLPVSRVAFAHDPSAQGPSQAGHGFLNAHVIGGFNNGAGAAFEDAAGFNYGLGVAPWARVGVTAIFGNGSANATSWESAAYAASARISNNSWGYTTPSGGPVARYDASAQEFDRLVRDARKAQAGAQELVVVFAAGNDGSGANTVGAPATAKNVVSVGASENYRPSGTDGCGIGPSGANDVDDVAGFSSRGPVNASGGDGRFKPDLVAPGTHVIAGVPQSSYVGGGTCDQYWPAGQTLYGWSSGTSHAAPAVAAAAALLRQDFLNRGARPPSPALTKAWLAHAARYMDGVGAGDRLPSNSQGMGRVDLGRAFDGAPRFFDDQQATFAQTGDAHVVTGAVVDGTRPVRITLAWTDAPGPTTGAPWVNDLDLSVTVGGATYRGNRFSKGESTTGGAADRKNNLESVFLPAGLSGAVTITVTAATIAGDGVPGNADKTDQDFALVADNVGVGGHPPAADPVVYLSFGGTTVLPGLGSVDDEDVVSYDPATGVWSMVFDGSDVGLGAADVRAVSVLSGGDLVLTFSTASFAMPQLTGGPNGALVTYRQAVRFTPTSLGANTAGTFDFYFDGEDVGLTSTGEALDAFCVAADGSIYVSTAGNPSVPGLSGLADEDVLRFVPSAIGATTTGTWFLYFDGSDAGFADATEDLDAAALDASGALWFSTTGVFSASGAAGDDEDVGRFVGSFGNATSGSADVPFDLSALGVPVGADVDGIWIQG